MIGGISAGATYDVIFSTRASLRRVRACLLAFHVTEEEYHHDDVIGGEFDQHLQATGFPGSVSDDVITAGRRGDTPGHLLSLNEEDVEEINNDDMYDIPKDESRSTFDYRKAESIV